MVKHNNIVPNAHFRKDWQRYVRTWFDQPGQKERRRDARELRAKRIAPRPLHLLRPAVRGQTNKYNTKVREGRGFTKAELKGAGISARAARGVGIAVDKRRRNMSEEAFTKNVSRLKHYKSRLVIFPRKPTKKTYKQGDTKEWKGAVVADNLHVHRQVEPVENKLPAFPQRKATKDEREAEVAKLLRKTLLDAKLWGRREKRRKDKEEAAKAPKREAVGDEAEAGDA